MGGIDLIITDLRLPGEVDGSSLANVAKLNWPQIGIIVLSGGVSAGSTRMPPDTLLMLKPVVADQLLSAIEELGRVPVAATSISSELAAKALFPFFF